MGNESFPLQSANETASACEAPLQPRKGISTSNEGRREKRWLWNFSEVILFAKVQRFPITSEPFNYFFFFLPLLEFIREIIPPASRNKLNMTVFSAFLRSWRASTALHASSKRRTKLSVTILVLPFCIFHMGLEQVGTRGGSPGTKKAMRERCQQWAFLPNLDCRSCAAAWQKVDFSSYVLRFYQCVLKKTQLLTSDFDLYTNSLVAVIKERVPYAVTACGFKSCTVIVDDLCTTELDKADWHSVQRTAVTFYP